MNESPFRRFLELLFAKRSSDEEEEDGFKLDLRRSGLVTASFLAVVVGVIAFLFHERGRGDLTRLEKRIQPGVDTVQPAAPRPGGMDAVVLTRSQMLGGEARQFLSATVLPGRGMNILQITAYIPGRGEIPLLASPTVDEAAKHMTGKGDDWDGAADLAMGAALLAPWADGITGTPVEGTGGADGQGGDGLVANWEDQRIALPAALRRLPNGRASTAEAFGGLLLKRAVDSFANNAMPDGGETRGTFQAGDFGGHWPSSTDVAMTVMLSGRLMELTLTAKNVGMVAEPMGLGWHPRFALPSGNRSQMRVHVPGAARVEMSARERGVPTGRLLPVEGTPYDLRAEGGKSLPQGDFDVNYTNLKTGFLDNGPIVELSNPANGYGIRITSLTMRVKAFHVTSPAEGGFVSISPQYNLDDPFGHEWPKNQDTGMMVLEPGATAEWKIRLELFDPATEGEPSELYKPSTGRSSGPAAPPPAP